ncbi:MAG: penicillin-binding protein 2, partial [Vicinamibacteria bacterium]
MTIRRRLFSQRRRGGGGGFGPELRNAESEVHRFRRRLAIAGGFVLVAFAALVGRFVYLQVAQHDHFRTLAETNRIAIVPIAPNRGVITDRNGVVLAQSFSAYTLEIQPSRVRDLDGTIDRLSEIVDIAARDRKRFRKLLEESKNFESLPIRTKLSDEEVARFAANRYRFPGVEIKARLFRNYPFGAVASHVLGYIGRINDRDLVKIASWDESA